MEVGLQTLEGRGLRQFQLLLTNAVDVVTERLLAAHASEYADFGPDGRESCREDLTYLLDFLQPVLEFGLLQPMVDYLRWLTSVLAARSIPAEHISLSLELLAAFFLEHMDAADGAVVCAALRAAQMQLLKAEDAPRPNLDQQWPEVAQFEQALLAGHQQEALAVVNHCIDAGHSLIEVEQRVIQPALYQIGEKWQLNQVTVGCEHLATAIAQSVMTLGLLRSPPPEAIDRRVLLACVAGNEHAIGLRMVADAFQLAGWDLQYLGANVPTEAVIRQAEEWKADLVGLSVCFPQQSRGVKEIIGRLGESLGAGRPAVIIGGLAINRFNRLAEMVGADAYSADAPSAVAIATQLVGSAPHGLVRR